MIPPASPGYAATGMPTVSTLLSDVPSSVGAPAGAPGLPGSVVNDADAERPQPYVLHASTVKLCSVEGMSWSRMYCGTKLSSVTLSRTTVVVSSFDAMPDDARSTPTYSVTVSK